MNWTMPYPWRSRSDSVRRINMSSEPGNESFFCALRPIPRILSLPRRDYASQVQIGEPSRRKTISEYSRAPDANRYGARCRCRQQATSDLNAGVKRQSAPSEWQSEGDPLGREVANPRIERNNRSHPAATGNSRGLSVNLPTPGIPVECELPSMAEFPTGEPSVPMRDRQRTPYASKTADSATLGSSCTVQTKSGR